MLDDRIAPLQQELKRYDMIKSSELHEREVDWAVAGGIGGVGAAIDAQIHNAGVRQRNQQLDESIIAMNILNNRKRAEIHKKLDPLLKEREEAEYKLTEERDPAELFPMLQIRTESVEVSPVGTIHLKTSIQVADPIKIDGCENPVVIDGVLRAKLMQNGIQRAAVYITLPWTGVSANYAGFVTGINADQSYPNAAFTVEYEPHALWLMER